MSDTSRQPQREEPEQAPPWRPEHGTPPRRTHYDVFHRPALWVRVDGRERLMQVTTRLDYADGRVAYQGDIRLPDLGDPARVAGYWRAYWWPQPGIRVAYAPPP